MSTLDDLREILQQIQIPLHVYDARCVLEQMRSAIDYLAVYQHYFPQQYACSMEQVARGEASLFPAPGSAYSPHEVRLLTLIDEHLFPLPLWYVLEDADTRC